jgi:hypothetical protein
VFESEEMDTNLAGLVDNLSNELNLVVSEVLKEKIEQVSQHIIALRDQSGDNESGGNESSGNDELNTTVDGEYVEEGVTFDTTVEKESFLKTPDNMTRSKGINAGVKVNLCKIKYACDLNFALIFDEYLAKCIREKICDNTTIKNVKLEFLNIIKAVDSEEMMINIGDTIEIIKSKMEKLKE